MIDVIAAAALTCVGALIIGQAACWLCGADNWTFLAAPTGFAVLMLVSAPAMHFPERASGCAVVLLVAVVGGAVLLVRRPQQRPRFRGLLVAGPTFALALLPFIANGRGGTLGVSFDNDMATHLLWAEGIRSAAVSGVTGISNSYPVGPHGLSAVLAQALGARVDYTFAGETMAVPILIAWTSLAALKRTGWLGRVFVCTTTALTFMVAGYYAEGSFKEPMIALLLLGFVIGLQERVPGDRRARLRWVPLGLIVGGALSVYSVDCLPWFVGVASLWCVALGVQRLLRGATIRTLAEALREGAVPLALAFIALVVLVGPQVGRLVRYFDATVGSGAGTGIPASSLGNLIGPVSFWKVFGIWDTPDFRLPATEPFHVGMFVAFGLLLTLCGFGWSLRRSEGAVPLAVAVGVGVWIYSNHYQSPYVAAKALVIVAPLVMLLATRWLVELSISESWASSTGALRVAAAALLAWAALGSSAEALRSAYVGPTAHADNLRRLEATLGRARTLFLGWDDFISWELSGTPVTQPFVGFPEIPLRPEKHWTEGQALEFEDIPATVLDEYTYVVTPRNEADSTPPSNMRLIRSTRYYELWKRIGPTPDWHILATGPEPAAKLECRIPWERALSHLPGYAIVRAPSVQVQLPTLSPGQTLQVPLHLTAGRWSLSASYSSPHPVDVAAPGLRTTIPATLDRLGNRWPLGSINVGRAAQIPVRLHVRAPLLASSDPTIIPTLIATRVDSVHTVPLNDACGKYVEWYTTTNPHGSQTP